MDNAMMSGTQAHKAIRNLVTNEYGITKECTQKLIEEKIADVTHNYLMRLNTDLLERTIKKVVVEHITEGVKGSSWYSRNTPFAEYIQQVITKTIQEEVIKQYAIKIERK
jgi:hypothetical protein